MDLRLTAEQEKQFAQLALSRGCDPQSLAHEALSRYLEEEKRFIEIIRLGEAELDRGEYLAHEHVDVRIDRLKDAIDDGDNSGIAEGDVFARVRQRLGSHRK